MNRPDMRVLLAFFLLMLITFATIDVIIETAIKAIECTCL